ncbi:MAG: NADH-quinone oxidoreductase subunit NuoE [Abitibacteriaceae bacterium]|nr:NADH-quinone oxidoreductase subunit NuoE [Abditibacteriaceae bacterium]MBV9865060.1 NADH-quinone oxidoreductase subunit NuoE [Abditibacteriaceae bacterium]
MLSDAAVQRIQEIVKEYPNTKSALVPALYVAQRDAGGWLPREAMVEVAEELDLPESHVYSVATFYSMFYLKPIGENVIQVCTTSPCGLRGANEIVDCFKKRLGVGLNETTADGKFTLMEVECLAACNVAPMAQINEDYYVNITEERVDEIVTMLGRGEKPPYAEFAQNLKGAHPIAFTDAELGIDVSGIKPADPVVKKEKPAEAAPTEAK